MAAGPLSDVVHRDARVAGLALDDRRDRRRFEDGSRGGGGVAEDALSVADEGDVEELDDLEHRDLAGAAGEGVAALDAALGLQHAGPAQGREELLEELHRDVAAARELADRDRAVAGAADL